jgi:ATP-binding cassette subfamily C protein CydC
MALFGRYWRWMLSGVLLGLLSLISAVGLLALAGWFLSAAALAGLVPASAYLFNVFYPSVGVRVFAISRTLARYGERIVSHDATFRILEGLRCWFYERLEPLAPGALGGYRSGDLLNRAVADIDALDNLYLRVLSPSVVAVVLAGLLTVFLWLFDGGIALWALGCLLAAGFAVPWAAGRAGADTGRRLAAATSDLRVGIVDTVTGLADLLVCGAQDRWLARVRRVDDRQVRAQQRMSHIRGLSTGVTLGLSGLAMLAVLYRGVGLVEAGRLGGPELALVVLAVMAAFEAVTPLAAAYQYLSHTRTAARRLVEIVETPPAVRFGDQAAGLPQVFDIRFEDVSFHYPGRRETVLAGFDFSVASGEHVAVLGETGCGKSTLVNLLVRFWDPQAGRILVGGRDLRSFAQPELRRMLSVAPQQVHLFNGSLRDNLLVARPGANPEEITHALAVAQLAEFVARLPRGLDTWIGESGRLLSGGEARRLAAARLVLHDGPVWLLDEPTEGLDRVTERRMTRALLGCAAGKTVIWITHRQGQLADMHRVIRWGRP